MNSFTELLKAQAIRSARDLGVKTPPTEPLPDAVEKALAEDRDEAKRMLRDFGIEVPK